MKDNLKSSLIKSINSVVANYSSETNLNLNSKGNPIDVLVKQYIICELHLTKLENLIKSYNEYFRYDNFIETILDSYKTMQTTSQACEKKLLNHIKETITNVIGKNYKGFKIEYHDLLFALLQKEEGVDGLEMKPKGVTKWF